MNYKSDYIFWATNALKIKGTTKQQYVSSIQYLSKIIGYNIFENDNLPTLNSLYEDLLREQKKVNGKYFDSKRPSSSLKGWYSASLKTYIDFLEVKNQNNVLLEHFGLSSPSFQEFLNSSLLIGLVFSDELVLRFISSLITKPFVILSGLSGSGKTKLAQSFAEWISKDKSQYCIVPVGADWTNRDPLLGYVNALDGKEYIVPENGALKLIIESNKEENGKKPYFLVLDEMNLSHVERYFADFLSVMESNDPFKLHSSKDDLNITYGTKYQNSIEVPPEISWPKNLFVIGTVNIDETTYMFSPKVLDRANVIEFRVKDSEMSEFLSTQIAEEDKKTLKTLGASMGESFVTMAKSEDKARNSHLNNALNLFFGELQEIGAEFGYRTASEIQKLFAKIDLVDPSYAEKKNEKIDIAIMQKLLPKLHGSRNKLQNALKTLAVLCFEEYEKVNTEKVFEDDKNRTQNIIYPISFEKITRMHKNVIQNGFTSYAEA